MNTKEYSELFRNLMERCGLLEKNVLYVENVAAWCKDYGVPELDQEKPLKLIRKEKCGCLMIIRENISDEVIDERINAMSIRSQIKNVAYYRADRLESDKKRRASLFLCEYAASLPDISDDELLADDWAFDEMEKLGYFRK